MNPKTEAADLGEMLHYLITELTGFYDGGAHDVVDRLVALVPSEPAQPAQAVSREFTNELGNRIKITIEGPTSTSENILTPMEVRELYTAIGAQASELPAPQAVGERLPLTDEQLLAAGSAYAMAVISGDGKIAVEKMRAALGEST